jgi:hypothetical protein
MIAAAVLATACASAPTPTHEPEATREAREAPMEDVSGSPVRVYLHDAGAYDALRLVERGGFVLLWVGEPRRVTAAIGVDQPDALTGAVLEAFGLECVQRGDLRLCSDELPGREPMPTVATERRLNVELHDVSWEDMLGLLTQLGSPHDPGRGVDQVRFSMWFEGAPANAVHEALVYLGRGKVDSSADPPVVSTSLEPTRGARPADPAPRGEECAPVFGPLCEDAAAMRVTGVMEATGEGAPGAMISCGEGAWRYRVRPGDPLFTGDPCDGEPAPWRVDRISNQGLVLEPSGAQDEPMLVPPATR